VRVALGVVLMAALLPFGAGGLAAHGSASAKSAPAETREETPARRLAALLEPVETLTAEFRQIVFGARYQVLQHASGRFYLARPLRFRWELDAPYEQLVVTVDDRLYIYDPDLEQVNVEPLEQALKGTPALILAGTLKDIEEAFEVEQLEANEVERFELRPRAPDSLYSRLQLRFESGQLAGLEIVDALDQRTEVLLTRVTVNTPIDPDRFSFEIPPDADVIGDVGLRP
jgi:outer membrane lipoprotein carrier protein